MAVEGHGYMMAYDLKRAKRIIALGVDSRLLTRFVCSPDGKLAAKRSTESEVVKIFDATTGLERVALGGPSSLPMAFSPDGSRVATRGPDKSFKIWDSTTGREVLTLSGHPDPVSGLEFSPDGKRLATVGETVTLWDTTTGKKEIAFGDVPGCIAFNSDGKRLATAGAYNPNNKVQTGKVWDTTTGKELLTLHGPSKIKCIAFSPNGRRLATYSGLNTVKIWDSVSGDDLLTLHDHSFIYCLKFTPDGKKLAAGTQTGVEFWDATPLAESTEAQDNEGPKKKH